MQYDVNRIEFVKTQKTKYVMQTSEYIFKICIGCIVHIYIFLKIICSLCPDMFCEMFYLLRCFAFAEIKCFCVSLLHICLVTFISFILFTKVHLFINVPQSNSLISSFISISFISQIIAHLIHIQHIWFYSYYIIFQPYCVFHFLTNPFSGN